MHPDDKTLMGKIGETENLKLEGVQKSDIPLNMSLKDFIYKFWTDWNENLATQRMSGSIHCMSGKGRSITDLFLLANYYYPDVRYQEVKDTVLAFGLGLRGHFCPDVERRICSHIDIRSSWGMYSSDELDEFGNYIYYLDDDGNKLKTTAQAAEACATKNGYGPDNIHNVIRKYIPRVYEFFGISKVTYAFESITLELYTQSGTKSSLHIGSPKSVFLEGDINYAKSIVKSALRDARVYKAINWDWD